jgi:hypothetical protein
VGPSLKLGNERARRGRIIHGVEKHYEHPSIAFGGFAAVIRSDIDPFARCDVPASAAKQAAIAAQMLAGRFVSSIGARHAISVGMRSPGVGLGYVRCW